MELARTNEMREIKRITNALYRASHKDELNRKQRERYATNADYREYQRQYRKKYWPEYAKIMRDSDASKLLIRI